MVKMKGWRGGGGGGGGELAHVLGRALIDGSLPAGTWTPRLEQTLHGIIEVEGHRHRHRHRVGLESRLVSQVIDPHLIRHPSLALGFFHWASQQPGFTHSSLSYNALLKSLSKAPNYFHIHPSLSLLYRSAQNHRLRLHDDAHATNALLASLCSASASASSSSSSASSSSSSASSSSSLRAHARHLFDHMLSASLPFTTLGLGLFFWRICPAAHLHHTLALLHHPHIKNQLIPFQDGDFNLNGSLLALLLLHGLCLAGRPHHAMHMLHALTTTHCKPDFIAYRLVAESLTAAGDVLHAHRLLKMKRKLGVAPKSNDYTRLIFQLISDRLIPEAKDLGEIIVAGNFPIEDHVLNALIRSVSTTNPSSALLFFQFLIAKQRLPTLLTFTHLCRNLCKHGNHHQLLQVSNILSAKHYFLDTQSYNLMLSFFCKAGKVKEAYQLLQQMKKKGLPPDVSSYNYVMEACCKQDMIRPAKRLWDEMFANGCQPNLNTYNILITKFSEIDQLKEAHMLFCHMLERGVQPDATTYDFLIKGFCQHNQLEAAIQVFNKSFQQHLEIANTVLEKFILYLCKKGEFVAASNLVYDYASTMGKSKANVMLLKYLADAGEVCVAIKHMKRLSVPLLHELRAELLSSLSCSSKPQLLLEMIQVIDGLHLE